MADFTFPAGELCAGQLHRFEANCPGAVKITWIPRVLPPGVSANDVYFTSPNGLVTGVIVPIAGDYTFTYDYEVNV